MQVKSQRIDTKHALDDQMKILSKVNEELDPINVGVYSLPDSFGYFVEAIKFIFSFRPG